MEQRTRWSGRVRGRCGGRRALSAVGLVLSASLAVLLVSTAAGAGTARPAADFQPFSRTPLNCRENIRRERSWQVACLSEGAVGRSINSRTNLKRNDSVSRIDFRCATAPGHSGRRVGDEC